MSGTIACAVLIVEDEATLARNIAIYLQRSGYEAQIAASGEEAIGMLDTFRPDAVLLDLRLPGIDGLETLRRLRSADASVPVLMLTGHGTVETAVQAMKEGAYDFLTKPVALTKLRLLLEKALGEERRAQAFAYLERRDAAKSGLENLLGESAPMRSLKERISQVIVAERRLTDEDAPAVLITGETGAGKEVVARVLHLAGPRADKPFVEINCTAIPAPLLESELFGHERGAFTGARERKLGLVETAEGGTLFLDEIGDMDLGLQAKLLKLLEEKAVRRVGSVRDQRVNVRIIAATHRPLPALVQEGRFRPDLYFRLRVVELAVPPLRERGGDVLLLARHFLGSHGARYNKPGLSFSPAVEALLLRHRWPGNVRELRNAVEQAVLLAQGPLIDAGQLSLSSVLAEPAARPSEGTDPPAEGSRLEKAERALLLEALESTQWNVSRAARLLGVSRDTLRYRMDKFQLASTPVRSP